MKKLLLLVCLVTSIANAQTAKFELTPAGFINADSPSDDYLVINAPGKTQEELYKDVLSHLHGKYVNPDIALSTIDGELITINGTASNAIRRNNMHVFDMDYTYTIRFKQGKVRVDAPAFKLTTYTSGPQELHLVWTRWSLTGKNLGIYGKKEKLKSERAKADLEDFFNTEFESVVTAVQQETEDW